MANASDGRSILGKWRRACLGGVASVRKVNAENILDRFSNPDAVIAWIEREGRTEWLLPEI